MSDHEFSIDDVAVVAIDADDDVEIVAHLHECESCASEVDAFREVASELANNVETSPPFSLRRRVLGAAAAARPFPGVFVPMASPAAAYAASVDALASDLAGLTGDDWNRRTIDGWTICELVSHLGAVDELVLKGLRGEVPPDHDIAVLTKAAHVRLGGEMPTATKDEWLSRAHEIVKLASSPDRRDDEALVFLSMPLSIGQVVVDRAFETWVHAGDIRIALGLERVAPAEEHLKLLTDLGARSLPMIPQETNAPNGILRLVLTGRGGGSWLLPFGADEARPCDDDVTTTLILDSVDFCLLAAARLEPSVIEHEIVGNRTLAEQVLKTAPMLARI